MWKVGTARLSNVKGIEEIWRRKDKYHRICFKRNSNWYGCWVHGEYWDIFNALLVAWIGALRYENHFFNIDCDFHCDSTGCLLRENRWILHAHSWWSIILKYLTSTVNGVTKCHVIVFKASIAYIRIPFYTLLKKENMIDFTPLPKHEPDWRGVEEFLHCRNRWFVNLHIFWFMIHIIRLKWYPRGRREGQSQSV